MPSVHANGITIEYDERGSGEPLLLVMGLAGQLIHWTEEFTDLVAAAGFRVVRFDNRDAGLSTEMTGTPPSLPAMYWRGLRNKATGAQYTLSDMADDAFGLMDALEIDSAHVVGASMGGMIAQTMAIEHPDRVRSLTSIMSNTGDKRNGLISPRVLPAWLGHKPSKENAALTGTELYSKVVGTSWDFQAHLVRAEAGIERSYRPEGVSRQMAAISASPDRTEALADLDIPTLVIHGLMDKLVLPSGGFATVKAIPGARLLAFPEMGHDIPMNRWEEIVAAIGLLAKESNDLAGTEQAHPTDDGVAHALAASSGIAADRPTTTP